MLTWDEIQANAVVFSKRWQGITSEKQQAQGFVDALLRVFTVEDPRLVERFEEKTRIDGKTKWIDYVWPGKIAIEMKSKGENLEFAFEQLRHYMNSIPAEDVPDLLKAHQALDKAVWRLYGFTVKTHPSEAAVVASLMGLYENLIRGKG